MSRSAGESNLRPSAPPAERLNHQAKPAHKGCDALEASWTSSSVTHICYPPSVLIINCGEETGFVICQRRGKDKVTTGSEVGQAAVASPIHGVV